MIASALDCGITRNAIIGKVNRLRAAGYNLDVRKVIPRHGPPKAFRRPRTAEAPIRAIPGPEPAKAAPAHPEGLVLDVVTFIAGNAQQCKWPISEPNGCDTLLCGAAIPDHNARAPYCPHHTSIAYVDVPYQRGTTGR